MKKIGAEYIDEKQVHRVGDDFSVEEVPFAEYEQVVAKKEAELNAIQEEHPDVITIGDVEEVRKAQNRMAIIKGNLKSREGVPTLNRPVTSNTAAHQRGFVGMNVEASEGGVLKKIRKIFKR